MCYGMENSALALCIYALWKCVSVFSEPGWLLMWGVNKDESGKGAISPRSWKASFAFGDCTMLPDWQLNLSDFSYLWWATESGVIELTGALPSAKNVSPLISVVGSRQISEFLVFMWERIRKCISIVYGCLWRFRMSSHVMRFLQSRLKPTLAILLNIASQHHNSHRGSKALADSNGNVIFLIKDGSGLMRGRLMAGV